MKRRMGEFGLDGEWFSDRPTGTSSPMSKEIGEFSLVEILHHRPHLSGCSPSAPGINLDWEAAQS